MIIIENNINIKKSEKMTFLLLKILVVNLTVNFSWYFIFFNDIFLHLFMI